jgi:hypothetical protein
LEDFAKARYYNSFKIPRVIKNIGMVIWLIDGEDDILVHYHDWHSSCVNLIKI